MLTLFKLNKILLSGTMSIPTNIFILEMVTTHEGILTWDPTRYKPPAICKVSPYLTCIFISRITRKLH